MSDDKEFMRRLAPKVADFFPVIDGETFDDYTSRVRTNPNEDSRAIIAAEMLGVSDEIATEKQAEKSRWIAGARREFAPGRRAECFVCREHRFLTHAHHLYPLAQQYDDGIRSPDQRFVWLCPNHHAMLHIILDGEPHAEELDECSLFVSELDIQPDEIERINSLIRHRYRGAV